MSVFFKHKLLEYGSIPNDGWVDEDVLQVNNYMMLYCVELSEKKYFILFTFSFMYKIL
jgi:hypothetical protein